MNRIEPSEVHAEMQRGAACILDLRSPDAYRQVTEHIPGDLRHEPDQVSRWADQLPKDRHVVAYCT